MRLRVGMEMQRVQPGGDSVIKTLSKELGLFGVFAICTGAMISSGLFVLPGIAAAKAGPAVVLVYLLSGVLLLPSLLSMAELSTAMPRAGGDYYFISRSLGSMFGTIDGVGVWLALVLKSSIAMVGFGAYLSGYLHLPVRVIAGLACLVFLITNLIGAKEAAGLQVGMVVMLLGILGFLVLGGVGDIDPARFRPFTPFGTEPLLPTTALVFVSYIGLTKVASVSEEVRCPERNIPLGMLLSFVATMVTYGLVVSIVVGVVPADQLHGSLTPVSDAAYLALGPVGGMLVCVAAVLAFATTANAGILSASRYLLAMSRDAVIPHAFSSFSRFRTPKYAIIVTSAVALGVVLVTGLEQIAKLASAFQLLVFAFVHIAVIVMRESGIESYDPGFKSPLYPYMQIAGVLVSVILIPEMGFLASAFCIGVVTLGVVWYNFYVRPRVVRVGAVAQMAERVAERLLQRDAESLGLKRELRQILKEKGLRPEDPFVQVVQDAEFIELGAHADSEDVLRLGAQILGERSGVSRDLIVGALLQRNRLGETPAEAGVALPHVLLDEVDSFYLVAARSTQGVEFPMAHQEIHAVFLLLGSRKNPTQHLRFLAEIARRAENPAFVDRWVAADSTQDLREILMAEPK